MKRWCCAKIILPSIDASGSHTANLYSSTRVIQNQSGGFTPDEFLADFSGNKDGYRRVPHRPYQNAPELGTIYA